MRFMVIVKATKDSEAGVMPSEQLLTDMGNYNQELVKAGIMLAGDGLHPSSKGARVRFSGKNRTVIDGPFAETKELIAGYWIWQCKSLADAIEWLKKCPNPMLEDSEIEIRQIFTAEDFGAEFTPELREQEDRIRNEAANYVLEDPRMTTGNAMTIAGLSGSFNAETRTQIPALWEKFAPSINHIAGEVKGNAYGVCYNCGDDCKFDYLAGVEVNDTSKLPKDFTTVKIPAGKYAVFTHRQHVSQICKTIDAIWSKWLPHSGFTAAETPAFERYTEEFNPQTGFGGTEIWVPLKS